jgi:hypothetical protein
VRPLRGANLLVAAAVVAIAATLGAPDVYGPAALGGILLFVVAAGALAADCFPWRALHAATSAGTMLCGLALILAGPLGLPPVATGAVAAALQPLPALVGRRTTRSRAR